MKSEKVSYDNALSLSMEFITPYLLKPFLSDVDIDKPVKSDAATFRNLRRVSRSIAEACYHYDVARLIPFVYDPRQVLDHRSIFEPFEALNLVSIDCSIDPEYYPRLETYHLRISERARERIPMFMKQLKDCPLLSRFYIELSPMEKSNFPYCRLSAFHEDDDDDEDDDEVDEEFMFYNYHFVDFSEFHNLKTVKVHNHMTDVISTQYRIFFPDTLSELELINIKYNPSNSAINLHDLRHLKRLILKNIDFCGSMLNLEKHDHLEEITIEDCINLGTFRLPRRRRHLTSLVIDESVNGQNEKTDIQYCLELTKLSINCNSVHFVDLSGFGQLKFLSINGNQHDIYAKDAMTGQFKFPPSLRVLEVNNLVKEMIEMIQSSSLQSLYIQDPLLFPLDLRNSKQLQFLQHQDILEDGDILLPQSVQVLRSGQLGLAPLRDIPECAPIYELYTLSNLREFFFYANGFASVIMIDLSPLYNLECISIYGCLDTDHIIRPPPNLSQLEIRSTRPDKIDKTLELANGGKLSRLHISSSSSCPTSRISEASSIDLSLPIYHRLDTLCVRSWRFHKWNPPKHQLKEFNWADVTDEDGNHINFKGVPYCRITPVSEGVDDFYYL